MKNQCAQHAFIKSIEMRISVYLCMRFSRGLCVCECYGRGVFIFSDLTTHGHNYRFWMRISSMLSSYYKLSSSFGAAVAQIHGSAHCTYLSRIVLKDADETLLRACTIPVRLRLSDTLVLALFSHVIPCNVKRTAGKMVGAG